MMHKVLVVSNDRAIHLLYADELGEEGYDITMAECCPGLMECIRQDNPDIIVIDHDLQDRKGFDMVRFLRELPETAQLILSTSFPFPYMKSRANVEFVLKSPDLKRLKARIKAMLRATKGLYWEPQSELLFGTWKMHSEKKPAFETPFQPHKTEGKRDLFI